MSEDLRDGGFSDGAALFSTNAKIYEESLVKFKEKFNNGEFKIKEELNYSSEEEDIDVGLHDNNSESDDEAAMDLSSDDKALENLKKKGVRSFGIDDILSHKASETIVRPWDRQKEENLLAGVAAKAAKQERSPLDALFTMASSFEALKQQSGKTELAASDLQKMQRSLDHKSGFLKEHPTLSKKA